MGTAPRMISIEVAYAEPERQFLRRVEVKAGATAARAIDVSGIVRELRLDPGALQVGIWTKIVAADTVLQDGDRVELYRPLKIDPKEARRRRAERGRGKRQS